MPDRSMRLDRKIPFVFVLTWFLTNENMSYFYLGPNALRCMYPTGVQSVYMFIANSSQFPAGKLAVQQYARYTLTNAETHPTSPLSKSS